MRITKQQQELIDIMREGSVIEECSFWFDVQELVDATGRSQQSISRSMNTFMKNGVVARRTESGERTYFTTWNYLYCLKELL